MPTLQRDGAHVGYEVHGASGPTVLFAHNLLCDRRVFDTQAARLCERFRVVRVDLRGHGESRGVGVPFTIADLAGDLLAVLDALGADQAHFVGLSMGASASMEVALRAPARVRSLIAMGATSRSADARDRIQNALLGTALGITGMQPWLVRRVASVLFGETFRREHRTVVDAWEARVAALDQHDAVAAIRAWAGRRMLAHELPAITAPTLVISGDQDVACPVSHGEGIRRAIPGAVMRTVSPAGHAMTIERPIETGDLIDRFVSEH